MTVWVTRTYTDVHGTQGSRHTHDNTTGGLTHAIQQTIEALRTAVDTWRPDTADGAHMKTYLIMVDNKKGPDHPFYTSDSDGSRPILVQAHTAGDAAALIRLNNPGICLYAVECVIRNTDGGAL